MNFYPKGQLYGVLPSTAMFLLLGIAGTASHGQQPSTNQVQAPGNTVNAVPFVVPALREWKGATGTFALRPKVALVINPQYSRELLPWVQTFADDLKLALPQTTVSVRQGKANKGDFYFTLNVVAADLNDEGYRLDIGDVVTIEAKKAKGAFWATRSLLQILEQEPSHQALPKGSARDWPQFATRGFVLDVGRKFFTIDFLRNYVRFMSYYKMNDFQIHLNDNGFKQFFNNDWNATYSAFRLQNDTYPNLTAKDGSYSKKEFVDLQILAEKYGVNIVPEIDSPAHALAFTKAVPEIGSQKYGRDHLDLSNPRTQQVMDNVFKEYLSGPNPVFLGPEVHIGTDEYAKEEAERFRAYTDHLIGYVESFGKKARLWGSLTHAAGTTPIRSKDVTMNLWSNGYGDPKEMFKQGYNGISTPDGWLYIVPKAGYYFDYLNTQNIYNNWTPNKIGNQTFDENNPQIKGGAFAVWNDHVGNGISEKDVHSRVFPAMQVLSQKMWDGKAASGLVDYQTFTKRSSQLGEGPGLNIGGKVRSQTPLVLRYDFKNRQVLDQSGNNHQGKTVGTSRVGIYQGKNALHLTGNGSYLQTPLKGIGYGKNYGYTTSFFVNPAANNPSDAVLFSSSDAVVKLGQGTTGKLGFSRDGYNYHFDYVVPTNQWTHLAIVGDDEGTTLYANGVLVESLKGGQQEFKGADGKVAKIAKVQTLFFPLEFVGAPTGSFNGYMADVQVFNKILSAQNIGNLAAGRAVVPEAEEALLASWKSGQVGEQWAPQTWDVTSHIRSAGEVKVRFQYTGGENRLDIAWVELLKNGEVVARDEHSGTTGGTTKDNTYRLKLSPFTPGAKYTLRASLRADAGNDSIGDIFITTGVN